MAAGPTGGKGGAQTAWVLNLLTDLAFNLLIFFVVCASTTPESGRPQQMPKASKDKSDQKDQTVEVAITRTTVSVNGGEVPDAEFPGKLAGLLAGKARPEERVVVVKSAKDTPYGRWVRLTGQIEKAGGVITLQLEEEKEVGVR